MQVAKRLQRSRVLEPQWKTHPPTDMEYQTFTERNVASKTQQNREQDKNQSNQKTSPF